MTQVARYGHMLKVSVTGMRMHVKTSFRVTGAVLNDTVEGEMLGAETGARFHGPTGAPCERRPHRGARLLRHAGACSRVRIPLLLIAGQEPDQLGEHHPPVHVGLLRLVSGFWRRVHRQRRALLPQGTSVLV
jgi:hypothetical protein